MNVRADGGVAIEPVEVDLATPYRHELPRLVRLAAFLLADPRLAEDVCQDVMATLLQRPTSTTRGLSPDRRHQPLPPITEAINLALAGERRYVGRRSQPADVDDALPNDAFFVRFRQLTTAQRTVVVLAYYEDLTRAAVAEHMDIPLGTVKSHLTRALDKMRTSAP